MPALSKATLQEVDNDNKPKDGKKPIAVQFNPTSLRLQYSNASEGGQQSGRQARQYTGSGSTTLTVDLVFDTADEGTTDKPVSVLERTKDVEYFITPQSSGDENSAPPRLCFQWGQVIVNGTLETLSVDLDHFAHDGTPLRAKASLSIKGQHPEYQFNKIGPGANKSSGLTPASAAAGLGLPGLSGSLGLSLGGSLGLSLGGELGLSLGGGLDLSLGGEIALGLEGESLAQLAQRSGLDPEAWRALANGIANPLSLSAGVEIGIGGGASKSMGMGLNSGVQSGSESSTSARVGLDTRPGAASRAGAQLDKGYALSAAGGVGAALETVKADATVQGTRKAKQDFSGASGAQPSDRQVDTLSAASSTTGTRNQVFSLRADPRATSFGAGVPLRDRTQIAHEERANLLSGQAKLKSDNSLNGLPPITSNPAVPGWKALPAQAAGALIPRKQSCGCGCSGGCGCSSH